MRIAETAVGLWLVIGLGGLAEADGPDSKVLDVERARIRGCSVGEDCRDKAPATIYVEAPEKRRGPWLAPTEAERFQSGSNVPPKWARNLDMPDIPMAWNDTVLKYIEHFRSTDRGRWTIAEWLQAKAKYEHLILPALREAALPSDLIYVAMVESSYRPTDLSYAGASGLWQFMPTGGKIYGLSQTYWMDERNDPAKATAGVALYFRDLYERFGDWHLALAAFNGGHVAVLRSVVKYNTNDFWSLTTYENGLPFELQNYVSKILAVALIGRNPAYFGFEKVKDSPEVVYEDVSVPNGLLLSTVAAAAGVSEKDLVALNPALQHARVPPDVDRYALHVPVGTSAKIQRAQKSFSSKRKSISTYRLRRGESLSEIAKRYHTSASKLARINHAKNYRDLVPGTTVVVPNKKSAPRLDKDSKQASETVVVSPVENPKKWIFYRVVPGDTVYGIAKSMAISPAKLISWNGLSSKAHLQPGMVLAAQTSKPAQQKLKLLDRSNLTIVKAGTAKHLNLVENLMGRQRLLYTARRPESFADIGKRYGLSARDLARINRRPHDSVLKKGESLVVYEVTDSTRSSRAKEQKQRQKQR